MKITNRIKIGASLLLLVCIVLPFSSCTRHLDEDGKSTYISKKATVETVTEYSYAWEDFDLKDFSGWLFLLCFIWPIPILVHRYKSKRKRLKLIFWTLEPIFLGGASYYIDFSSTFLATPAIGAYLMQVAYFSYGISWISEVVIKIANKRKSSKSNNSLQRTAK